MTPPQELDPRIARSRTRLLDAATDLLVDGGVRAVTTEAVCERSGVAKSTLYRQWTSITELLVDVMRHCMPAIEPPSTDSDFETSLRTVMGELAAQMGDERWMRVFPALISLRRELPDVAEIEAHDRSDKLSAIQVVIELGVREGRLAPDTNPERIAQLLVGPVLLVAISGDIDQIPDVAADAAELFIRAHPRR